MVNSKVETAVSPTPTDDQKNKNIGPARQQSTEAAMDDYLSTLGLYRKPVAKDGSCLFRVVAEQVYHSQAKHLEVRRHCVKYMKDNMELFQGFVEGSFEHHIYHLQNPKEWAGQVEISALSLLYKRDFIVYQSINCNPTEVTSNGFKDKIYLCYSNGNHYDCVYPKTYKEDASFVQALLFEHLYTTVLPEIEEMELQRSRDNEDSGFGDGYPNGWTEVKSKGGKGKLGDEVQPSLSPQEQIMQWERTQSLDPNIYRNIELEVWERSRQEQQSSDRSLAAKYQFRIGDTCLATLKNIADLDGTHKVKIEDIIADQSIYLVTAIDLNQKFHVAMEDLKQLVETIDIIDYNDLPGTYRKSDHYDREFDFQPTKKRTRPPRKGNTGDENSYNEEGRGIASQRPHGKSKDFRSDSGRRGGGAVSFGNTGARNKPISADRLREEDNRSRGSSKRGSNHGALGSSASRLQGENAIRDEESKQGSKRDTGASSSSRGRNSVDGVGKDRRDKRSAPEGKSYKRDRGQVERKVKGGGDSLKKEEVFPTPSELNLDAQKGKSANKDPFSALENSSIKSESSVEDGEDSSDTAGEKGKPVKMKQNFESPADFYCRMRKKQTSAPATSASSKPTQQVSIPDLSSPSLNIRRVDADVGSKEATDDDVEQATGKDAVAPDKSVRQGNATIEQPPPAEYSSLPTENDSMASDGALLENGSPSEVENRTCVGNIDAGIPSSIILKALVNSSEEVEGTLAEVQIANSQTKEGSYVVSQTPTCTSDDKLDSVALELVNSSSDEVTKPDLREANNPEERDVIEGLPEDLNTFSVEREAESPLSFMDADCLENVAEEQSQHEKSSEPSSILEYNMDDLSNLGNDRHFVPDEQSSNAVLLGQENSVIFNDEKPMLSDLSQNPIATSSDVDNPLVNQGFDSEELDEKSAVVDNQTSIASVAPIPLTKNSAPEQKIRILRKDEKLSDVDAKRYAVNESATLSDTDTTSLSPSSSEDIVAGKQSMGIITSSEGTKEKKTKKVSFGGVKISDDANSSADVKATNNFMAVSDVSINQQAPCQPMNPVSSMNGPAHIPITSLQNVMCQGGFVPMIQGHMPMQTNFSLDVEGRDLPEDRHTLRFFYNLGVQYFCMVQHQMQPGYPGIQVPPPVQSAIVPTSIPPYVPSSDASNIVTESHLNRLAPPFRPQSAMNQRIHHQSHRYSQQPQYQQQQQHKMQTHHYQPTLHAVQGGPYPKYGQDSNQNQNKELPPRFRNNKRSAQLPSSYRGTQDNSQRQGRRGMLNTSDQHSPKNLNSYR